jgi:hypothetical protein
MVLFISALLLVAGSAVLFSASMNSANVSDAVADQQAYYAAESGIQSALNVLRGHVLPSPLFNSTPTNAANRIDYRKATIIATSNTAGDPTAFPRFSRWINYNFTPPGGTAPDRVTLGTNYTAQNGQAYSLSLIDPDNTGSTISYTISKYRIDNDMSMKTITASPGNYVTIEYNPPSAADTTDINIMNGPAATNFGTFTIRSYGLGASIPTDGINFSIVYRMTSPYVASRVIRGVITSGLITPGSIAPTVRFSFESTAFELMGSRMVLASNPMLPGAPASGTSVTQLNGQITGAEPQRILVRSNGFGPRGARKQLEAIVQKNFFNGLSAPSTLTLVGPSNGFVYQPGDSNASEISGNDAESTGIKLPPVGVTDSANLAPVISQHADGKPALTGKPANVEDEIPDWLRTTTELDATVRRLKVVAEASGKYFVTPPAPINIEQILGDYVTGTGITFIDGDLTISPQGNGSGISGGGILVVTGKLTLGGTFNFRGLILITGQAGFARTGGGGGKLEGNMVVSPYNKTNLAAGFLPPKYDASGNGASDIIYNSSSVNNGLVAISNFILGVAEK